MRIMVQLAWTEMGRAAESRAHEAELYVSSAALLIRTASAFDTRLSYQFRANVRQLICRHLLLAKRQVWHDAPARPAAALHRSEAGVLRWSDANWSASLRHAKSDLIPRRLRARWHSQAPVHCRASHRPLSGTSHPRKLCASFHSLRSIFRGKNSPKWECRSCVRAMAAT